MNLSSAAAVLPCVEKVATPSTNRTLTQTLNRAHLQITVTAGGIFYFVHHFRNCFVNFVLETISDSLENQLGIPVDRKII
jgi:hypothetical protein